MRRPGARSIFTLFTLLLFLSVCALWAWSYRKDGRPLRFREYPGTLFVSEQKRGTIIGAHDYSDERWELAAWEGVLHQRRMHRHRYWPGNTGTPPSWWPVPSGKLPESMSPFERFVFQNRLRGENHFGFGVRWSVEETSNQYPGPTVTVWRDRYMPIWPLAVATAVLPAVWGLTALRRRLSIAPGHCRQCGYDLRATPGRCPECGAIADASRAPA